MAAPHNRRAASPSAPGSAHAHPTPRKVVPIKHPDGQPLSRVDIQFDFLNAIFGDTHAVFTNPYAPASSKGDNEPDESSGSGTDQTKVTFRDLYVNSILYSPKATKVLKDKMGESAMFAVDFAMLALLVNVGRVNTTMSCEFP
jgi:Ino eighty subunit 1